MAYPADSIAALATPLGTSALAIVRMSGPSASPLVREIFENNPLPRMAHRGDYRDRAGTLLDDVVYVFFEGPKSYTGEDMLEISCHGSPLIVGQMTKDLCARGCRPAEPGEFTKRAFLNGRMDLSQAEAVVDLIHAQSERALVAANRQLRGSLGRRMQKMTDCLIDLLARVEAYIDFPEEDLPAEDRSVLAAGVEQLLEVTGQLLATGRYGEILRHGVKTVILGEPNAGKSSLLNRLLGHERALVSAEPGTTRDYIEAPMMLGPYCINLVDTAGLNASPAPLEKLGMAKTMDRATEADLILLVLDATRPTPRLSPEIVECLIPPNALAVINKVDLVPAGPYPAVPPGLPVSKVSALTGDGCDELVSTIVRHAESFGIEQGEDAVVINARHAVALGQAVECLKAALAKLTLKGPIELLASDLRCVLDAYGQIAGKVDNEQMLDRLFARFCIGK